MNFPVNITKEFLLQAIDKIDSEGVPSGGESKFYDVFFNGKRYPPKVVVSFANLFANGEILDRKSFDGGIDSPCFKLLTKNGFNLIPKVNRDIILVSEIVEAIASDEFQSFVNQDEFYFEKAKSAYDTFKNLEIFDFNIIDNIIRDFKIVGKFKKYYQGLDTDSEEFRIVNIVAKLISYCDVNAAYKSDLNEYSDNRVLAKAAVRQNNWFENILKYKKTLDFSDISPSIRNALSYLQDSRRGIPILSENHREKFIKTFTPGAEFDSTKFMDDILDFFQPYGIICKNELNYTRALSFILYKFPSVRKLWLSDDQQRNESNLEMKAITNGHFIESFLADILLENLIFNSYITKRYIASLGTKPFVIFTGLSGSGKTKLAQTFAKWICASDTQYNIIPVGADWTNREPLLGYPNSLDNSKYVLPDNGALDLILAAIENSKDKELKDCNPYFMVLDEMNLSHVERYFADFLSAMESKEPISLYSGNERKDENGRVIPQSIVLPSNLFLVGTVNIDETTYMFSPKVLDRANTIEFKVDVDDMKDFFGAEISVSGEEINGKGVGFSSELMGWFSKDPQQGKDRSAELMAFFRELQGVGAEFGYRTAGEMVELMNRLDSLGIDAAQMEDALDVAVMQKLLPKLHGSRSKLSKVIPTLISLCLDTKEQANQDFIRKLLDDYRQQKSFVEDKKGMIKLKLSITKLSRMHTNAIENGFASFAEA